MQLIGVGPGRTGTLSVKTALESIGFGPCHHMTEVFARPELAERWADALGGAAPDWPAIFDGYRATVDWPSMTFWRELVDYYPDAKVLLTTRDPERWYASMRKTILARAFADPDAGGPPPADQIADLSPEHARLLSQMPRMQAEFFGIDGRPPTLEEGVAAFERHVEQVKQAVPSDRLLVFEVSQGWQPLCDFLEVGVPDVDFPRVNDAAAFEQRSHQLAGSEQRPGPKPS